MQSTHSIVSTNFNFKNHSIRRVVVSLHLKFLFLSSSFGNLQKRRGKKCKLMFRLYENAVDDNNGSDNKCDLRILEECKKR